MASTIADMYSARKIDAEGLREPDPEGLRAFLAHLRLRKVAPVVVSLLGVLIALFLVAELNFLVAHALVELFSVTVAWGIFLIVWHGRRAAENGYFLMVAAVYLWVGAIDLLHTVAYDGMDMFHSGSTNLPTQLWVLARYIESGGLVIALLVMRKEFTGSTALLGTTVVAASFLALIFAGGFPDAHIAGVGLTRFKILSEYVIIALMGVALLLLWNKRRHFSLVVVLYLAGAGVATILAELSFTMYIGVDDFANTLGHYFKLVSFWLLYRGVLVNGIKEPEVILLSRLRETSRGIAEAERRVASEASEKKVSKGILNHIDQEICILDRATYAILDANRTFTETYGDGTLASVLGRTCHEVIHGLDAPCSTKDNPCPIETSCSDCTGRPQLRVHYDEQLKPTYKESIAYAVPDDSDGRSRVVYISRDVTERVTSEMMREDVERVIRHDMKSPLIGVVSGARLLAESTVLNSEQLEILEAIEDAGRRALSMISHSLDMYKMARGTYQLDPTIFDLRSVVARLLTRLRGQLKSKGLRVDARVDSLPLEESSKMLVQAEEEKIEVMLGNLLQNAIDATPRDETVTLDVARLDGSILIDLHNKGVVPKRVRLRFFEPYVTAGKVMGTGLGTYSARLIARAHGGEITFTTSEEEGTHLLISMPVPVASGEPV